MSVIAEFHFSHPGLPVMTALAEAPAVTLHVEQAVAADPERPLLFFWATGGDLRAFDHALRADDSVTDVTVLEDLAERRLYRVQITDAADVVLYPLDARVGASRLDVTATAEGLDVRTRLPDREALSAYRELVADQGVEVALERVYSEHEGERTDEFGLSPKQREALARAVAAGYYDVPREAALSDVAEELGVSPQAASERLRRGVASFVRNAFR